MMTLPNPIDGGFADALRLAQAQATPGRGAFGTGLQSGVDDGFDLFRVIHRLAPASRAPLPQTIGAFFTESLPPQGDGFVVNLQIRGNHLVLLAPCGGEHDPAALRYLLRRAMGGNPARQFALVGWAQCDRHDVARHSM